MGESVECCLQPRHILSRACRILHGEVHVVRPDAIQITQHALRRASFVEWHFNSADEFSGDISHEHLESAVVEQQSHVVVLPPLHDGSGEFVCGYPVAVTLHSLPRALYEHRHRQLVVVRDLNREGEVFRSERHLDETATPIGVYARQEQHLNRQVSHTVHILGCGLDHLEGEAI